MTRRRRILLLGLAVLLLLAGGLVAAVLWPTPSEGEQWAAKFRVGMALEQAWDEFHEDVGWLPGNIGGGSTYGRWCKDGSFVILTINWPEQSRGRAIVTAIVTTPPDPVHPLTRLRRTLALAFPFQGK
jgi:hypothetical protein